MPADARFSWSPTSAPPVSQRYDDVWFRDRAVGWAVNSSGQILKTTDGGNKWDIKFQTPLLPNGRAIYLRCITFASELVGWVGTLTRAQRLYETSDGGESWHPVQGLPAAAPAKLCGLWAVDQEVIYGSGTNDPSDGAAMIKSIDGGKNWTAWDMSRHASNLIDVYFPTPDRGWVVGGFSEKPHPTYDDVLPVVLATEDGGKTWEDRLKPMRSSFPEGTWGWKIQFLDDRLGFVSLENMTQAFILKTTDGGKHWAKIVVTGNANLEGVGFINANEGWVGGWGDEEFATGTTSVTTDGGETWNNADSIGKFINRFRLLGNPVRVGYAAGRTVYKYTGQPQPQPVASAMASGTSLFAAHAAEVQRTDDTETHREAGLAIAFTIPPEAQRASLHIWNRFGKEVRTLFDETNPSTGPRSIRWDRRDDQHELVPHGIYIYRLTVDDKAESRVIAVRWGELTAHTRPADYTDGSTS
jgi:photosystem II stability/assembly factor-like uncharacterized protein